MPASDRDNFRVWSAAFVEFSPDEQFMQQMVSFVQYIERMVIERRITPQDDLLSALVHAEANGEQLNEMELYSMVMLLIVAGHETTANLIANGMLALLQHPEQMQQLRDNPDPIPNAIEEFLRYDGSVERTAARFASEDVELCGQTIPRRSAVIVVLGAGNRDSAVFEDADALDISRQNNKHLGFGYGIHYCLGAPLARLEGKIAVETLLRRIPTMQLAAPVEALTYRPSMLVRGLVALPVSWKQGVAQTVNG